MKKLLNKGYRNLSENVFSDMEFSEFIKLYKHYLKLSRQYHLLRFCTFLERIHIPRIEIFLFRFLSMFIDLLRWKLYDFLITLINGRKFDLYGVTCYCGRQGSGKTIGVVEQLEHIREKYPKCIICTNINYLKQDLPLTSWLQLLYLRNGDDGVVFVIDEVQNNGLDWTKFPETLLSVITQQRKQKIKIFVTSQVYKNLVIQLRRQCFDVIECKTFLGRWTKHRCYDADEYNNIVDLVTPERRMKLHRKWKHSFIQSNFLRQLYDTNQVVDKLKDFDKLVNDSYVQNVEKGTARRLVNIKVLKH